MATEYNKLVIFDLDGVLIDSRELHYQALNDALKAVDPKYIINRDEHLSTYDGLPTKAKMKLLSEQKGLPASMHETVWRKKQESTIIRINDLEPCSKLIQICLNIKNRGYKIAVASNSIRDTVKTTLLRLGIMDYVEYFQTNEDVMRSKPYPQMYWNCMNALNAIPSTTIIIEDSHIGRQGAIDSGSKLLPVEDPHDVTWDRIEQTMNELDGKKRQRIPWRDAKLNVLIPMAGAGSRFANAGFTFPKPLIDVRGKPMVQVVVENMNMEANFIFIVQKEHYEKYNLQYMLQLVAPGCKIVQVDGVTEGAACTVLMAKELINNDDKLFMINSDQFIEWNSNEVMYSLAADQIDGGILTFESTHPKYSYVKTDDNGFAAEVVEKKVISNMATVGAYYWTKGSDFVKYAEKMVAENRRVNNEFYVAPVYQEAIDDGKKIKVKNIEKFWSLGTPEDLTTFLQEYKK
jgi:HAD superfamily hydrolase (TIGR01509 family)